VRNDSGHPSHCCQPLCFAKGILCFQLGRDVPDDLQDCVATRLERLSTCDGYFLAVAGELDEISIPFTGLRELVFYLAKSHREPGLQNLVN
jgi:hypothetical protein